MRLSKKRELLLSPDEWATVSAVHEAASNDFEAVAQALADVRSGAQRSMHIALRLAAERVGAEQVQRAAHNWAVHKVRAAGHEGAERSAADPLNVLQGVLLELAVLHHEAHELCVREGKSRARGGRPKGVDGAHKRDAGELRNRPSGRPRTLSVTDDELTLWEVARRARGETRARIVAMREFARRKLVSTGHSQPAEVVIEKAAQALDRRLRSIINRKN